MRINLFHAVWAVVFGGSLFAGAESNDSAPSRQPISSLPFVITQSGDFYATTNLTGSCGIAVLTNNVTIDLNGFALTDLNSTNSGIFAPFNFTNLVVSNGSIRGWSGHGIYALEMDNCRMTKLEISSNAFTGLNVGDHANVTDCRLLNNGTSGVLTGTHALVKDCLAQSNRSDGIHTSADSQVLACLSLNNSGNGITIGGTSAVRDSTTAQNRGSGIYISQPGCQVTGNTSVSNNPIAFRSNAGIYVFDSSNHIEGNRVTANGYAGICVFLNYSNNVIVNNTVTYNVTNNYIVPRGNDLRPAASQAIAGDTNATR